jgi:AbiU2
MANQSGEEVRTKYVLKMGERLGQQFYALWQEIALLHVNWKEYIELFGTNKKRVERLNNSASTFFRMIQDQLWTSTLLHIARLLDPPRTGGKANLTLRNLTDLVAEDLKMPLAKLIDKAIADAEFARDWRNRVIAHIDLSLALQDGASEPPEEGSRAHVNTTLQSLADVMNEVEKHYADAVTVYSQGARHNSAITLLYLLGDGLKAKAEREYHSSFSRAKPFQVRRNPYESGVRSGTLPSTIPKTYVRACGSMMLSPLKRLRARNSRSFRPLE